MTEEAQCDEMTSHHFKHVRCSLETLYRKAYRRLVQALPVEAGSMCGRVCDALISD